MRILFDTNVIIAAFISHGACHELFEYCITSNHKVFLSEWILDEVQRKLINKFKYPEEKANEVIILLRRSCNITRNYKLRKKVCRDKDDDNILSAGIFSKVDCIISGDADLLDLKTYKKIEIITPREFWIFEKEGRRY